MLRQPRRGGVEHGLWQDQAVGGDHGGIEVEGGEGLMFGGVALQPGGGADGQAEGVGGDVHRAFAHGLAAAGGAGGLTVDRGDIVAAFVQGAQRGDGEIRTAHEREAHQPAPCFSRWAFASLRQIMLRLSAEM